jgi:hypothetical protein
LLLWNFARTPHDLWVDGPLRSWGLVVVFHITAVAAGWSAWRLMRLGNTPPPVSHRTPRTSAVNTGRQYNGETVAIPVDRGSTLQPAANSQIASPDDGARHWFRDSVRLVREAVSDSSTNGNNDKSVTSPAASTVAGPGITEWGALFVRRTREMMSSARDHVSPTQQARTAKLNGELNGIAVPPQPDPLSTWPENTAPESPSLARDINASPIPGTWPTSSNGSLGTHNGHLNGANGATHPAPDHTPVDPVDPAPTVKDETDLAATEDARWTWVESAAAAWMSRRERDDPPADLTKTPPPPVDDAPATS